MPSIVVDFLANTRDLVKGVDRAKTKTDNFSAGLKSVGKAGALAAGAAGVGALVATLKIGIDEYTETQKVAAQTNAVIKSTGGVANVTAQHVDDLAGALMHKSGVDDEVIASGENLLLTFTNVRNEVGKNNDIFDQATKAALDMSVALGTDMTTASMQLGKALNDPAKGLTRLQRVGVTFTDSQKEAVKAMQASGDTMGAQRIILAELTKEFGGSAEAVGKTLPGQINIAKQTFNNWAGDLVTKMIPVIQDMIGWLRDHWPEIQAALKRFWADVKPIIVNLAELLMAVVKVVRDHWDEIGPPVMAAAHVIEGAVKIIGTALKLITDLLKGDWSAAWKDAKQLVVGIFELIKDYLRFQVTILETIGKAIGNAFVAGMRAAWDGLADILKKMFAAAINGVIGLWNGLKIPGFKKSIDTHLPGVGKISVGWPDINFPNIDPIKLARGGIVTGPTMGLLGEAGPELVVPLTGGGAPVEVRVFIGETELRGIVRTEVVTENNKVAQTLLAGRV